MILSGIMAARMIPEPGHVKASHFARGVREQRRARLDRGAEGAMRPARVPSLRFTRA